MSPVVRCAKRFVPLILAALLAVFVLGCEESPPVTTGSAIGGAAFQIYEDVDGYMALIPKVLRAGEETSISFTLTNGDQPARSLVNVEVLDEGKVLVSRSSEVIGTGTVTLDLPAVTPGEYQVRVVGQGFDETTPVQIQAGTLLFLETDKPIYKPGQKVMMRLVALNSELRPVQTQALVEVRDAKGIKIFKQMMATDEYGTSTAELPLSTEPNLGVWKVSAAAGASSTELDVRVEKYVLPKYEVEAELTKDWFLVDEPITGHVTSKYSYGREVSGELKVTAYRYVGEWEEYATYAAPIDGAGEFTVEAAGYVAGVPGAGGLGNVRLDIAVTERNTGYEQIVSELVTVADSPVNIRLIAESATFKPGLPFNVLMATETPGGDPLEAEVSVEVYYYAEDYSDIGHERQTAETRRGADLVQFTPPEGAVRMAISAASGSAWAGKELTAAYSPSGSFIHVQQTGDLQLAVGDTAQFSVAATAETGTFYYEVVARDRVVFSSSGGDEISFRVTPAMAPAARLLVYRILSDSEVAADSLPFDVAGEYPHEVQAAFGAEEVRPGDRVDVHVRTEGPAKVGLVAVDHSVFVLAENRLNLQQVFSELERLYMRPQVELHEAEWMWGGSIIIPGAKDTFEDAGLIVVSNKMVPEGKELEAPKVMFAGDGRGEGIDSATNDTVAAAETAMTAGQAPPGDSGQLAEVQRIRQFFPETWIWDETMTDDMGTATISCEAPDSITTWDLRAVALSPQEGLGIAETSLTVFQPFFLQADLPYSALRGEEFPVKIALYNYLDTAQDIQVEIEPAPWFDLLDDPLTTVTVAGGDIGSAEFRIRPKTIGTQLVEVTARSSEAADAVIKSMLVEPEGVGREVVENVVLDGGQSRTLGLPLPDLLWVVPDSERAYVAVTGSLLAQTIEGLDQLLQMPFGCGEQNMILFAPDALVLEYLKETGQLKPEIQAKAEMLLITGYQRELTYRHSDGSFSAFGEQDELGSLFLTAFVLKSFSQAKELTFIDETVLSEAASWITGQQQADGSFESVGFVCHGEMMGGVQGKDALTAYVAVALLEAGHSEAGGEAVAYLQDRLDAITDPYTLALMTYALELGGSSRSPDAARALLASAVEDENGLHWSGGVSGPMPEEQNRALPGPGGDTPMPCDAGPSLDIEATGYAALALIQSDDRVNAGQAIKWLAGRRNSQGGFGTTQDTVVALQAMTEYSTLGAADTRMTVTLTAGDMTETVEITPENYDVTQVVEVPAGVPVEVGTVGKGEAIIQGVLRYNLPSIEEEPGVFDITVDYDTAEVEVSDLVTVDVEVAFDPPEPVKAGMVVLDVSVPTGFDAVESSLAALLKQPGIKRYEMAGRKVIVYIENMAPGARVSFSFQAVALYPVRGKGAASTVYSYYMPEWRGETVGSALQVH